MKKLLLLLVILCLIASTLTISAISNDTLTVQNSDKISPVPNKSYMWSITPRDDISGNSYAYILGGLRVCDKNIFPLDSKIETAYQQCSKLLTDLDVSKVTPQENSSTLVKYGMLAQTSLEKVLSAESYKHANMLIKKYTGNKKSLAQYSSFKPWVIENLIINLELQSSDMYIQNGISSYFIDKAQKDRKPVLMLESLDFQYKLLASQSYSIQNMLLDNTLDTIDKYPGIVSEICSMWKNGDSVSLEELYSPNFANNDVLSDIHQQMSNDRNRNAAEGINSYLKAGGKYFVVLDASMLSGDNSVLKQLVDMGYIVEQQ